MHTSPSRPSGSRKKMLRTGPKSVTKVIAGAPGDQPVPDLVKRVERRGLQPEMVDAAPPEHRRLAVGFGVACHLKDV